MNIDLMRKRLYALQKQAATGGIYVDPSITIQIEDLKRSIADADVDAKHCIDLLRINRNKLQVLLTNRDSMGNHTPPHIINGITDTRNTIAGLKSSIIGYGYAVDDLSTDSPEVVQNRVEESNVVTLQVPQHIYKLLARNVKNDYDIDLSEYVK